MILPSATVGLASIIPESGSISSSTIRTQGFNSAAVGLTSTQAGQISVQRYLDGAALTPQGAPVTQALTANVAAVVNLNDPLLFSSFVITVTNTNGSAAATLSDVTVVIG